MTDKSQEFLRKLLATFREINEESARIDKLKALKSIEDDVDLSFVNGLSQWVESQNDAERPHTVGKALGSVAYWLALEIAHSCERHDHVCVMSQLYGDYIHEAAHAIYDGECNDAKRSKK